MGLGNITKRTAKAVASSAKEAAASNLSSYVKGFGIVGDVLVAAGQGAFGKDKDDKRTRSTRGSTTAPSTTPETVTTAAGDISVIKSTLLAINKTLASMLDIQRRDRADRLYAAEGLTREKAAGLGVLGDGRSREDKGKTSWGLIGALVMSAIGSLTKFITGLPAKILAMFGMVAGIIKDAVIGALGLFKDGIVNLFQWLSSKLPGLPTLTTAARTVGQAALTAARFAGPIAGVAAAAGGLGYMISRDRGNRDETDVAVRQAEAMESGIMSPEEVSQTYAGAIKQTESVGGLPGVIDQQRPKVIPQENISRLKADSTLGGINYEGYKEAVGRRESSGNYQVENTLGYLGKYQMGVPALIDAGVMVPNPVGRTNKEKVNNPANWRGGYSKEEFLNNPELQEDVMRKYTIMNYRVGRNIGVIKQEDAPEAVAAKLASAHLVGWGNKQKGIAGARDYFESGGQVNPGDAYGSKVSEYANIGRASQQGAAASMQPAAQGTMISKSSDISRMSGDLLGSMMGINNIMSLPSLLQMGGAAKSAPSGPPQFSETTMNDPSMISIDNLVYYAP